MEITQDIQSICAELLERYKNEVLNSGHKASGELVNTARYLTKWDGKYFELYFQLEDYWKYLENGTKPHFPPIDKIEQWVRVKPVVPKSVDGKIPTTRQLAFLIAREISKNGTKATKLLQSTLDGADDLINRLAEAFEKQLEEEINNEEL